VECILDPHRRRSVRLAWPARAAVVALATLILPLAQPRVEPPLPAVANIERGEGETAHEVVSASAEMLPDTDSIRAYQIEKANLFDLTDGVIRALQAEGLESRRIYVNMSGIGRASYEFSPAVGHATGCDVMLYPDPSTEMLFVRAHDAALFDRVQQLVQKLDVPPVQIEIEMWMMQNARPELSLPWTLPDERGMALSSDEWEALMKAIHEDASDRMEIVSAPRVVTRANPTTRPRIHVGTSQPWVRSASVDEQGELRVDLDWLPIGIAAEVVPLGYGRGPMMLDMAVSVTVVKKRVPVNVDLPPGATLSATDAETLKMGCPVIAERSASRRAIVSGDGSTLFGFEVRGYEPGLYERMMGQALPPRDVSNDISKPLYVFVKVRCLTTK